MGEVVTILSGIGQVFTNPTVIVSIVCLFILYKIFEKVFDDMIHHFSQRLEKNDKNMKEFQNTLRKVSNQMERISTITESQSTSISEVKQDIRDLRESKQERGVS